MYPISQSMSGIALGELKPIPLQEQENEIPSNWAHRHRPDLAKLVGAIDQDPRKEVANASPNFALRTIIPGAISSAH